MKSVKHIYVMGSGGFGLGNITPVAEFNVYVDAEAFDVMLRFDLPLTIVGFDVADFEVAIQYDKDGNKLSGGSIQFIEKTYDYYVTNSRINQEVGMSEVLVSPKSLLVGRRIKLKE